MRHTVDELLASAYHYYARGIAHADPGYYDTEERQRLIAARRHAGTEDRFERWRHMIFRLEARFPDGHVMDRSLHLHTGTWDACYSGRLIMPPLPGEDQRHIGFLVSFLVPHYVVYTNRVTFLDMNDPAHREDWVQENIAFTFAPDEEPYARVYRRDRSHLPRPRTHAARRRTSDRARRRHQPALHRHRHPLRLPVLG